MRLQYESAQKRIQGKRTSKRKNKRSNFFKRPKRSKTANTRDLSSSKSDKLDSEHNPDESLNYADDEGQDVDMEGEEADGKV